MLKPGLPDGYVTALNLNLGVIDVVLRCPALYVPVNVVFCALLRCRTRLACATRLWLLPL